MTRAAERSLAAGRAARERGDLAEAARRVGEAFARFERIDDPQGMARSLVEVAVVALDGGDPDTASRALGRALPLVDPATDPPLAAAVVLAASRLALEVGDPASAVRLHAGAAATGVDHDQLEQDRARLAGPVVERARAALGPVAVDDLVTTASAMTVTEVVGLAGARSAG